MRMRMDVMSPEDIEREGRLQASMRGLANMRREEATRARWHGFSQLMPFAIGWFVLGGLGIWTFWAMRMMADAWAQTDWIW